MEGVQTSNCVIITLSSYGKMIHSLTAGDELMENLDANLEKKWKTSFYIMEDLPFFL